MDLNDFVQYFFIFAYGQNKKELKNPNQVKKQEIELFLNKDIATFLRSSNFQTLKEEQKQEQKQEEEKEKQEEEQEEN